MCLGENLHDNEVLNFNNLTIQSSKEVENLGIKIDNNLNFNKRKINLQESRSKVKRSSENIFQPQYETKKLYKSIIKYQFNYYPLVWMFCSKQSKNLINKRHKRSLRISYKDQKTSYHNLFETYN